MEIPEIKKQTVLDALQYIDTNGAPFANQNAKFELVAADGKRYSPADVLAVSVHLSNGSKITADAFSEGEAKKYLEAFGFVIEEKKWETFTLKITCDEISSTDERFTVDNIGLGDNYRPLDVCLKRADGSIIRRTYSKGERRNSNMTMPRIACQVFEQQLSALSAEDKESFPICRYTPSSELICGIYTSVEEYRKHRNTLEYTVYNYDGGRRLVFYCWNIFSTIFFLYTLPLSAI